MNFLFFFLLANLFGIYCKSLHKSDHAASGTLGNERNEKVKQQKINQNRIGSECERRSARSILESAKRSSVTPKEKSQPISKAVDLERKRSSRDFISDIKSEPSSKFVFSSRIGNRLSANSVSFIPQRLQSIFAKIVKQSLFEQEVEDVNSFHKMENVLSRQLIVMPLNDSFKINQADVMHQKVQYGDKCSLPSSLGRFIYDYRIDVPWIFQISPVNKTITDESASRLAVNDVSSLNPINAHYFRKGKVSKAYISPLDFRSPENYIFLPKWLMNDLNVETNDLVEISLLRIKLADLVVLQPLTVEWDDLMKTTTDPKTLLEHEINKYSSLTAGTTIYIKINGKEFPIYVKETKAEGGISVHGVRVQDSDIKTDVDRSIVDRIIESSENLETEAEAKEMKEIEENDIGTEE
jgi:ubiquitin fusion degradation protein 1